MAFGNGEDNGNGNGRDKNEPDKVGVRYRRKRPIDVNEVEAIVKTDDEGKVESYEVRGPLGGDWDTVDAKEFESEYEQVA